MSKHGSFGFTSCTRGVAEDINSIWLWSWYRSSGIIDACLDNIIEMIHLQAQLLSLLSLILWNLVKADDVLKIF